MDSQLLFVFLLFRLLFKDLIFKLVAHFLEVLPLWSVKNNGCRISFGRGKE